MAHRFGLGTELEIDLPGARTGFIPTREWRIGQGQPWNLGDTVVRRHRPGLHPGHAAAARDLRRAARHRARGAAAPDAQAGRRAAARRRRPADWPSLGLSERSLHAVREGMWAVVNEAGGTAPDREAARSSAGRWPARPARRRSAACRASSASRATSTVAKLPWEFRPHALFVAYAPYDAPRYALSVVVEHGNAGAAAAAPIARDIMIDALQRDPAAAATNCRRARRSREPRGDHDEGRAAVWRETSFDLGAKLWQVNWLYVLLLCALAGVGYAALYSAAGGAPEPYASRHVLRFAFGLVLMIGIALVDIRFIARLAWPLSAWRWCCWCW